MKEQWFYHAKREGVAVVSCHLVCSLARHGCGMDSSISSGILSANNKAFGKASLKEMDEEGLPFRTSWPFHVVKTSCEKFSPI